MLSFTNYLQEARSASNYVIYHESFSDAVQHALAFTQHRGYEVDLEDEWFHKVTVGPRKPSPGKTNSYSIDLMKRGRPTREKLNMQVYNTGKHFELNMYIS